MISLCKISYVCLFVCLGSTKEVMLNQPADVLRSLSHQTPAVAFGNTSTTLLLFFGAILITLTPYESVFPPHLLYSRKYIFPLSPKKSTISFPPYSIYPSLSSLRLSYPTFHTCMIAFDMTAHDFTILNQECFLEIRILSDERD